MRTINIAYKLYTYEELSSTAQERVRQWLGEDDFISNILTDVFTYRLEELGLPTSDIRYSLNNCQGDGVAFYGGVDLEVWLNHRKNDFTLKEFRRLIWLVNERGYSIKVEKCSHASLYNHAYTMEINGYYYGWDEVEDYPNYIELYNTMHKAEQLLLEEIRKVSGQLESDGYSEIEYQYSDENARELCEANGYEFLEDGSVY